MTIKLPLRTEFAAVEPYGAPQIEVPVRLNVNENPYPPAPELVAAITAAVEEVATGLNRYPDRDFYQLRKALAEYLAGEASVALTPEQIWAGNGSNEVIMHLLTAYAGPGRTILSTECSYSMYPEYARNIYSDFVTVPREKDFSFTTDHLLTALKTHQPAVLLLANPNNPTGTASSVEQLEEILMAAKTSGPRGEDGAATATIVVIDEAYGEFRRSATPSLLSLLEKYPHLVVTRTLSKSFGMAGLRLGYFAANPEIVQDMLRVRLPYHLSALTQAAALAALKFQSDQAKQIAKLRQRRDDLGAWLENKGFQVPPSDANFVLFGPVIADEEVFQQLLQRGVLIRNVGPAGYLRVTVGTGAEDQAFRTALEEVLADISPSEKVASERES